MLRFASVFAFLFFALLVLQAAHAKTTTKDDETDERKRVLVERRAEFKSWSEMHEKTYESPDHEDKRFQIWMENDEKIKKHNSQIPISNYTLGHNAFSDMTYEEFAAHVGLMTINAKRLHHVEMEANDIEEDQHPGLRRKLAVPLTVDWRTIPGVLSPVRDSGMCSCSYAMGAVGAVESFLRLKAPKGKIIPPLSVQQIVDCDTIFNQGCDGGWHGDAIEYAATVGLVPNAAYLFRAVNGKCRYKEMNKTQIYQPQKSVEISTLQNGLKIAVAAGPVAVAIEATQSFQSYSSGILNGLCAENDLNHVALAVGYDSSGNWILQNSWGTTWGEKGYVRFGGPSCGNNVLFYPYTAA